VSGRLVLAVDGGNSKTHVAIAREDGAPLAVVRGPLSSPHMVGLEATLQVFEDLVGEAAGRAGIARDGAPIAARGEFLVAGADLPEEELALQEAVHARGWAAEATVVNDTFAVLRAGTERGWGVAVVCGAGINCVGVGPDGRQVRFPALGTITGDWGGGYDLGLGALWAACRSEDGRGPGTTLASAVPAHFGRGGASDVGLAVHRGEIPRWRLAELARVVLAQAEDDSVAAGIVDGLTREIAGWVRVTLERIGAGAGPVDVVLGGGMMRGGGPALLQRVQEQIAAVAPQAEIVLAPQPIVGAALLGLDALGAGAPQRARLRRELAAAAADADAGADGNAANG
jgi:N-acetylglucosamine kinase-like BadF-type ATPase